MSFPSRFASRALSTLRTIKSSDCPVCVVTLLLVTTGLQAQRTERPVSDVQSGKGWFTQFSGGYLHQLKSDLDSGGEMEGDRYVAQASVGYRRSFSKQAALGIEYVRDAYRFDGIGGFSGPSAWNDIHTVSVAGPIRWSLDDRWTLFVLPSIRVMAEESAEWEDAITGGGIAGASFKINDQLTLGPGLGVLSQIEDDLSVFPVLLIDWKINERLRLETGRGLGASQGPGLLLSYKVNEQWKLLAGGRYERLRFRLAANGVAPNGVGEDRGAPVFLGVRYSLGQRGDINVFSGVDLGGKLMVDNPSGDKLFTSGYEPAPFFGFSASFRF